MVSRPLDVVGPLDCRDLQALDHQTGEKVATAGQHRWDRGREDREDEETPLLEQLHQLHQDTRAGWDHLDSQPYPLDRLDGRRPLVDVCSIGDELEEEENLVEALLGRLGSSKAAEKESDGWAHCWSFVFAKSCESLVKLAQEFAS